MCGIIGYFSKGAWQPERRSFEEAAHLMFHRGPDQWGTWFDERVGLGFRRLSIIDLNTGHQPMSNEDGSLQIIFNGEIYNFKALREELRSRGHGFRTASDTEVILHLFEEEGEKCVERLRGMFALAIYNRRDRSLFLARDRFGKKPLIYANTAKAFWFASEISPLLRMADVRRTVNASAIQAYLAFRYVPGDATAWKDLKRLPPATRLWIRNGMIEEPERYWTIQGRGDKVLPREEVFACLRSHLEESVKLRMISDVPLGAFLSGGVDSSVLVAAMSRSHSKIKTFCMGFKDAKFDESAHARKVAQALGTDHHEMVVAPDSLETLDPLISISGEPFADQSIIPTHLLSRFTRGHVTVAISGDGGDELFSGYKRYRQLEQAERLSRWGLRGARLLSSYAWFKVEQIFNPRRRKLRWPRSAVDRMLPMSPEERFTFLVTSWHDPERARLMPRKGNEFSSQGHLLSLKHERLKGSGISSWQQLDMETYLPDDILRKVDWASMACSLECRCPYLDHPLVDWLSTLARGEWEGPHSAKYLLKQLYPDQLPPAWFDREKKGFSMPIGDWMLRQWKSGVESSVKGAWKGGMEVIFERKILQQLWNEHQTGVEDHGDRLWTWHVLNRWNELYKPDWGDIQEEEL